MGLKTETYIGVADCHGIESLHRKTDTSSFDRTCRMMRAGANRQRHACYFEADLDKPAIKLINESLKVKDWAMALVWLKQLSVELRGIAEQAPSWNMIPDIDLDPYA
jgi:hypothetical protein